MVALPSRARRQTPATKPSTSRADQWRSSVGHLPAAPAEMWERSAWERATLSYWGRNRTGAGMSGSGRGAEAVGDLAEAGQARPGLDVHGAGRAERGQVAQDDLVDRGGRLDRAAEPVLGGGPGRQALLAP